MKLPLLIGIIAICALMATCSKDKYTTKPQLELKSVNGNQFPTNADIQFQFIVTDKQGDIQNKLWVQKISLVCSDSTSRVPTPYAVPDFTGSKNLKVDLDVNYIYGTNDGRYPGIFRCAAQRDDSLYFRFWLEDKAGNVSDTITSPTIVLLKD